MSLDSLSCVALGQVTSAVDTVFQVKYTEWNLKTYRDSSLPRILDSSLVLYLLMCCVRVDTVL